MTSVLELYSLSSIERNLVQRPWAFMSYVSCWREFAFWFHACAWAHLEVTYRQEMKRRQVKSHWNPCTLYNIHVYMQHARIHKCMRTCIHKTGIHQIRPWFSLSEHNAWLALGNRGWLLCQAIHVNVFLATDDLWRWLTQCFMPLLKIGFRYSY